MISSELVSSPRYNLTSPKPIFRERRSHVLQHLFNYIQIFTMVLNVTTSVLIAAAAIAAGVAYDFEEVEDSLLMHVISNFLIVSFYRYIFQCSREDNNLPTNTPEVLVSTCK